MVIVSYIHTMTWSAVIMRCKCPGDCQSYPHYDMVGCDNEDVSAMVIVSHINTMRWSAVIMRV